MRLSLYLSGLAAAAWGTQATGTPNPPPIRNIFTFPINHFIENIAVRANGNLLITSMSVPTLFSIDPTTPSPTTTVIHTFPNGTGLMGITELTPDTFAIVTGIWDLANTRAAPGSLTVWTVDLSPPRGPGSPGSPKVTLITTVANSTILNGLAAHPRNPSLLLAADSAQGALWRINLATGAHDIVFSSPLFTPTDTADLGINGLRAAAAPRRGGRGEGEVYFTNSAQGLFGKVAVDWRGEVVGGVEVLARSGDAGVGVVYDDIALDLRKGKGKGRGPSAAWVASHPSYAVRVGLGHGGGGGGGQWVVNDTGMLLNPTSAAFGRGGRAQEGVLYVTLGGRFEGMDLVEGGVVAVDLGRDY